MSIFSFDKPETPIKYYLHIPTNEFDKLNSFLKLDYDSNDKSCCFITNKDSPYYIHYRKVYVFVLKPKEIKPTMRRFNI